MAKKAGKEFDKNSGSQARKLVPGERVEFDRTVLTRADTRFGETTIVIFASKGQVVRKCFAQGGMLEWLSKNPASRSICLESQLEDGDYTYNVWSE